VTGIERISQELLHCDVCGAHSLLIGYEAKNEMLVERTALYSAIHRLTAPKVTICIECLLEQMKAEMVAPDGFARCSPAEKALVVQSRNTLACFFDNSLLKLYADQHRYGLSESRKKVVQALKPWIAKEIREALDECIRLDGEQKSRAKNVSSGDTSFWQASPGFEVDIFKELIEQLAHNIQLADKDIATFLREDKHYKGKLPAAAMLAETIRLKYWKWLYEKTPTKSGGFAHEKR
jgi:hypothetical protein